MDELSGSLVSGVLVPWLLSEHGVLPHISPDFPLLSHELLHVGASLALSLTYASDYVYLMVALSQLLGTQR